MRRFILLSCVVAAACGARADAPLSFAVRDSAGVRIVEYVGELPSTPTIQVADQPLYRVGDGPGEPEWRQLGWGALQPDGGAVVGDAGSRVVAIGPDGKVRSTLAESGQGPSEVKFVNGVRILGQDTVLVQDRGNGKVLVFEGGVFSRAVPMPTELQLTGTIGATHPLALLLATSGYSKLVDPWLQGRLIRFDLNNPAPDTVGAFDYVAYQPPGGPMDPFLPRGIAITSGDAFLTMRTDLPEIVWRTTAGRVTQIVRWSPKRTTPTDADLKAIIDSATAQMPRMNPGMSKEQAEKLMARQRFQLGGEPFPVLSLLQGDDKGGVWMGEVEPFYAVTGIRRWSVLGPDGSSRGSVTLPDRFRLMDVRGTRVLGVLTDSMDVQSVAVYELKGSSR